MRLLSCHIENFGNISGTDYVFDEGITEFCRENGCGKTTLASFIKSMFYGLPVSRKGSRFNDRQHFYPFGGGKFGGSVTFEMENREYKMERYFDRSTGTKDSIKVYCNGNLTDEFGVNPGKIIFGLDEESFERTIFLTSEETEVSATGDISAKLNHYVDHTDESSNFETALSALEKAGKALRASRGKNDLISRQQAKVNALRSEIENLTAVGEELDRSYGQREELAAEIKKLEEQECEAAKNLAILQKWEVYDTYQHSLASETERAAGISAKYPEGLPEQDEIRALKRDSEKLLLLAGKMEDLASEAEDGEEWMRLSEESTGGIPSEEELSGAERQISCLDVLLIQIKELREREPSARQRELSDRFQDHFLTEEEKLRLSRYAEQYTEEGNGHTARASSAAQTKRADAKIRFAKTLLITGLIMTAGGAAVLFFVPPAGVLMAGLGAAALAACGCLYLRLHADGREHMRRQKEADERESAMREILAAYGYGSRMGAAYDYAVFQKDLEEYEAFCEEDGRRMCIYRDKEEECRRLLESVEQFFEMYGIQPGTDKRAALKKLRMDAEKYRHMKEQAEEAQQKRVLYEKQCEEQRMHMESILAAYQIDIEDHPGRQAEALASDRREYDYVIQNIENIKTKMEDYREKNNLGIRPGDTDADMEDLHEKLSERRRRLAAADRETADMERQLEDLAERQDQLMAEEGLLENYQEKHMIYMAAASMLRTAEQNLREKYVRPVRERFCHYAAVLEKLLGEKIMMDRDFRVFYEQNGEMRTERHLSAGQRSICQLCFRLALTDNMFEKEKPFFVMDDPFTGLDAAHMSKIAKLLKELAGERQILYFCCHESRKLTDEP